MRKLRTVPPSASAVLFFDSCSRPEFEKEPHPASLAEKSSLSLSLSPSRLSVIYEFDRTPDEQAEKPQNDHKTGSQ